MHYIFVTGGSLSGIGKGTLVSALSILLQAQGLKVTMLKIDPYLNIDAGTISPLEHGEVFVLDDGHECDLDLGNYERSLERSLTSRNNLTTGKIFSTVFNNERCGTYLGKTVQMVPHVTDCIQNYFKTFHLDPSFDNSGYSSPGYNLSRCTSHSSVESFQNISNAIEELQTSEALSGFDAAIVEMGGTVGDIESAIYLEALQQFISRATDDTVTLCHLVYIPTVNTEQKTKCAQHSFKALREAGLFPNFIFARCSTELLDNTRNKLAMFSGLKVKNIISLHDAPNGYAVPLVLIKENFYNTLCQHLSIEQTENSGCNHLELYNQASQFLCEKVDESEYLKIAFIVKYEASSDTYLSVIKAVEHVSVNLKIHIKLVWITSELLVDDNSSEWDKIKDCHSMLIPGGFGVRGTEGMIKACRYSRENKLPLLGICLGMQIICIEAARTLLCNPNANSEEFGATGENRVILYMPDYSKNGLGATMRLGLKNIYIQDTNSVLYKTYNTKIIQERHRHRYEFNISYKERFTQLGYNLSAFNSKLDRLEAIELSECPFFVGVQYHPEYLSKLSKPSPIFKKFIETSYAVAKRCINTESCNA